MEVVAPPPPSTAVDFNFYSNCSSPYFTAPSSPQRFGNLFSTATISPTRVSTFLNQLNNFSTTHSSSSIPFQWEQQPGVPKYDAFEFNFSGQLEPPSLSTADELFDGGKIKPLKPPPRLHSGEGITSPRSASEGRATDKDPLRNYDVLSKKATTKEDVKNSSFRSTQSSGSVSRRRRRPVSAHELHYTMNRAASEEMKKKTSLPYKQGLLGCMGFNPRMNQISRGIGSFSACS
ncbi:unnamed protein product [Lupinus luteus]|uniref:Uncharacterized protein n=1 Tax=Lupinus luteus TaxID=3873 RepID=A0AAV1WXF3_LUPLU